MHREKGKMKKDVGTSTIVVLNILIGCISFAAKAVTFYVFFYVEESPRSKQHAFIGHLISLSLSLSVENASLLIIRESE